MKIKYFLFFCQNECPISSLSEARGIFAKFLDICNSNQDSESPCVVSQRAWFYDEPCPVW